MKTLKCNKCQQNQASGKFCLDCGGPLTEIVTLDIQFKRMETNKSPDRIKSDIRKWLVRIGVQNSDIQLARGLDESASVEYKLSGKRYYLQSSLQRNFANNLAAIEQLLHYRVIGIERGIETTEQAFAGYTALEGPSDYSKYSEDELKRLLKQYHPDTGIGNNEEFIKVKAALDALRRS